MKKDLNFADLLNASPDPTLVTDTNGAIYYVNLAWEKLTGYTLKEVRGKNPKFLNSGKTPRKIYKKVWKNLSQGGSVTTEEIIDRKKSGEEYQIQSSFFPVKRRGKNKFYVQVQNNITRRKELEKLRAEFISFAAHELRTPITTLKLYADILLRKSVQVDEKGAQVLKNINAQSDKVANLLNDLLQVNKINFGSLELNLKTFDLYKFVENTVEGIRDVSHHKIILRKSQGAEVLADEYRIEQVLMNFLTNAFKYSPSATKIIIRIVKKNNLVILSVQDFGNGIKKESHKKIFKEFYRAKDMDTSRIPGFGLGLYISSKIIKAHKGKIWVESDEKTGSTFYFSLPMIKPVRNK